jgi:predicted unusual protein kinase regulating ubiquinone biosynthesis (AarF/ABC1/UbiB family)
VITGRIGRGARLIGAAVRQEHARLALGRLKGGAQKLGQTLALVADGMPDEVRRQMGALFSAAEPVPWSTLAPELEALPADLRAALTVDPEPLAAASVGQVHRGRLDGVEVVVKVLYPDITRALTADLDNLAGVAAPARLFGGAAATLTGLRAHLLAELDLRVEAQRAQQIADAVAPWPHLRVAVPVAATERVLVAPHLPGSTLHDTLPPEGAGPADPHGLAGLLVAAVFGPVFRAGVVNADGHPGNFVVTPGGLGLIDFGAVAPVPDVPRLGATLDRLLVGDTRGALDGLGVRAGPLEAELGVLLGPLGPGAWPFGRDDLMEQLGQIKRRHPFAIREVPFDPARLPLIRATIGLHHALRRLGVDFALGACLADVRAAAAR